MTGLLDDYEAHLRRVRRTPATIDNYIRILRRMDRDLPCGVAEATLEELEGWIFEPGRTETTYCHYVTIARTFGKWATDPRDQRLEWHASEDLPDVTPDSEEIRPATEQEFAEVMRRAAAPWLDLYYLAGWAGMRSIEIHRIERQHLTEKELRIFGKGNKWRAVPTHPILWERFSGRPAGPLARNVDGKPLSNAQVIGRGNYYLRKLDLNVSMHMLRKRFASAVYEASGHDIRLVQHLLGHKYVSTTQKYLGVDGARAASVVTGLPGMPVS